MAETMLSQSLMQNNEESKLSRDPFQQAQNQFASKQSGGDVLSSSLMQNPLVDQSQSTSIPDLASVLSKIGVDDKNLAMNDMGRFQLIGRLKAKYGDQYAQNEEAVSALEAFDQNLKSQGSKATKSMNQALASANRTLEALFGGSGGV